MKKRFKKQKLLGFAMLTAMGISLLAGGAKMNVVKAADDIAINESTFPDAAFRDYVTKNIDTNGDGILTEAEREKVSQIFVNESGISDLTGIGYFTKLSYLSCYGNNLTSLDMSGNPLLASLFCYNNKLTSLNVSNNPALDALWCEHNSLTSLDVSNNPLLEQLDCYNNQLTELNVSACTALDSLNCSNNHIASLDVSNNTALLRLRCSFNHLESLDVSHNTLLQQCDMTNNWMYTMDFSKNTALSDNNIPYIYTTGNVSMKAYRCGEDAYYIDLNDLNLDLSRVSYNRNMGTYDADTGRINFTFANSSKLKGQSFAYIYDTKAPGVKYKNLEVKMTIAEIVDVRDPNATTEETTTKEVTTEAPTTATTTETTTEAPATDATTETATTGTTVTEATTTQETLVEAPTTTQNVAGNQVQGPKTGDKAPVYTLLIVSCMSLAAAAVLYKVRKRR